MLYMTRRGVYSTIENKIISDDAGEKRSKKNPYGFLNGERIMGFRRGIKNKDIPHTFVKHCDACGAMVLVLRIPRG